MCVLCSCSACSWVPAEEHRGDESHAEPDQSPRDPGHNEGAVKGNDEGHTLVEDLYSPNLYVYKKNS